MAEATVIDAFVVTLGIDPRQYKREIKEFRDGLKQDRQATNAFAKDVEASGKKMGQAFRMVRNEVAGFLLLLAGANSLKGWITDTIHGAAETGRFADQLGVAADQLYAWEEAVKTVGGTADDIRGSMGSLVGALQEIRLTGNTAKRADLNALGMTEADLQNPIQGFLKLAALSERMSRPEFRARLQRIGISESTIILLAKGRDGVAKLTAEYEKKYRLEQDQIKAAQELEKAWAELGTALTSKLRGPLTDIIKSFTDWIQAGDNLEQALRAAEIAAIALIAAFLINNPLAAIAAAVLLIAANWDKVTKAINDAWNAFSKWSGIGEQTDDTRPKGTKDYLNDENGNVVEYEDGSPTGRKFNQQGEQIAGPQVAQPAIRRLYPVPSFRGNAVAASAGGDNRTTITDFFRANGFTDEQAKGIYAGIHSESGGNPNAKNPTSGAFGIGQWLGKRKTELLRRFGPNPSLQEQLQFLLWELQGGDPGGASVRSQTTAAGTATAYLRDFMRPGKDLAAGTARALALLGGGGSTTTTNNNVNITVYARDADGVARAIKKELGANTTVMQANGGMTR